MKDDWKTTITLRGNGYLNHNIHGYQLLCPLASIT